MDMSDIISREALRQAMYHKAFETDTDWQRWDSGCWIRYKMFERVLESMPSAQKTGRWVDDKIAFYRQCSECGANVRANLYEVFLDCDIRGLHYCPNCGAKMGGDDDGDNS